jgi:hypothetical protein
VRKGYSEMTEEQKDELALGHELGRRLREYRAGRRARPYHGEAPPPKKLDIDTAAYMVAAEIRRNGRTFGKILPEIVANQDALRPGVRRFLIKMLRARAEGCRRELERRANRLLAEASTGMPSPTSSRTRPGM